MALYTRWATIQLKTCVASTLYLYVDHQRQRTEPSVCCRPRRPRGWWSDLQHVSAIHVCRATSPHAQPTGIFTLVGPGVGRSASRWWQVDSGRGLLVASQGQGHHAVEALERVERARTTPLPVVDGDAAARATPETARYSRTLGGSIWLIVLKQRRLVECGTASQRS